MTSKRIANMSEEAIRQTIERRNACKKKALEIVESFLVSVSEEKLIESCEHLTQENYQDAIEERVVEGICGYPICSQALGRPTRQTYHISVRSRQVYDITERKKYCSNFCFKASTYLKNQLSTAPLWLPELVDKPPERCHLLRPDQKTNLSGIGHKVDLTSYVLSSEEQEELRVQREREAQLKLIASHVTKSSSNHSTEQLLVERAGCHANDCNNMDVVEDHLHTVESDAQSVVSDLSESDLSLASDNEAREPSRRNASSTHHRKRTVIPKKGDPVDAAKRALYEWFTLASLEFLVGSEEFCRLRAIYAPNGPLGGEEIPSSFTEMLETSPRYQQQYLRLCQMLDAEEEDDELEDREYLSELKEDEKSTSQAEKLTNFAASVAASSDNGCFSSLTGNKPPHRKGILKKPKQKCTDTSTVTAVTTLKTKMAPKDGEMRAVPSMDELARMADDLKIVEAAEDSTVDDSKPVRTEVLPPMERSHRTFLRRSILCDKLVTVLPDVVLPLELDLDETTRLLRDLVFTFYLTEDSVVIGTPEIVLVILALIVMLSRRDGVIRAKVNTDQGGAFIAMILEKFSITSEVFDDFLKNVQDAKRLFGGDGDRGL